MGYKDTVISWANMVKSISLAKSSKEIGAILEAVAETQAEITWDIAYKAGIREVAREIFDELEDIVVPVLLWEQDIFMQDYRSIQAKYLEG